MTDTIKAAARWYDENWEGASERPAAALREQFGLKFSDIIKMIAEEERADKAARGLTHDGKPTLHMRLSPWRCDCRRRGGPYHIDLMVGDRVIRCSIRADRDDAMRRADHLSVRFGLDLIIEW